MLADALSYAVKHKLFAGRGCSDADRQRSSYRWATYARASSATTIVGARDQSASEVAGERFWPMPMDGEYEELIHSEIADVKQSGGRPAGSIRRRRSSVASLTMTPWAHLDIAGVNARHSKDAEGDKGATGFGVRTFVELATLLAGSKNGKSNA